MCSRIALGQIPNRVRIELGIRVHSPIKPSHFDVIGARTLAQSEMYAPAVLRKIRCAGHGAPQLDSTDIRDHRRAIPEPHRLATPSHQAVQTKLQPVALGISLRSSRTPSP